MGRGLFYIRTWILCVLWLPLTQRHHRAIVVVKEILGFFSPFIQARFVERRLVLTGEPALNLAWQIVAQTRDSGLATARGHRDQWGQLVIAFGN